MYPVTWWPMLLILTLSLVLQVTAGIPTDSNIRRNAIILPGEKDKCKGVSTGKRGICETEQDCIPKKGFIDGYCGYSEKHCCIISEECFSNGNKVKFNNTYIKNTEKTETIGNYSFECWFVIPKQKNIKQIRLEFIEFDLPEPNKTTGICQDDILFIRGGIIDIGTTDIGLCGNFTGQHLHYNVNGDITISYSHGRSSSGRFWEINIIQVDSRQQAPMGCYQYFQQSVGRFTTFNYMLNGVIATSLYNYIVCIRIEKDVCALDFELWSRDKENSSRLIEYYHETNIHKDTYEFLVEFGPGAEKINPGVDVKFLQRKSCNDK